MTSPLEPTVLGHAVFRALLRAMSRPGTVVSLPAPARDRPLLRLLEALLDGEVTFHPAGLDEALRAEVAWSTGARTAPLAEADFLLLGAGSGGALRQARRGTLEYPDRGATAVYQVAGLAEAGGRALLRGPGIREAAAPRIEGLEAGELALLREVNAEFPLGVDAVFLGPEGRLLCIPRSTRIEVD
jgi:alpha-D-ribose 1-methylphosphonate 5-triphosphate synthase subunit PhnH